MSKPADLNRPIIESLYAEALLLADDVRASFDFAGRIDAMVEDEDLARIALSCEALRTTTRMMHVIAWLLNQRAFFNGEISEFQLRRSGRLPVRPSRSDPQQAAMLPPPLRDLVGATERFYARIERLDRAWHQRFAMYPTAIHRLRDRLGQELHCF
jgi:regulator of CtrA degradation